jgi:hypothetical protein
MAVVGCTSQLLAASTSWTKEDERGPAELALREMTYPSRSLHNYGAEKCHARALAYARRKIRRDASIGADPTPFSSAYRLLVRVERLGLCLMIAFAKPHILDSSLGSARQAPHRTNLPFHAATLTVLTCKPSRTSVCTMTPWKQMPTRRPRTTIF